MDCATCRVRIRTEWFDLDCDDVEHLSRAKIRRDYAPGEHIFRPEDPCRGLYYVASGLIAHVRRFGHAAGGLLTFRHPGDVLGLRSFLSDGPHLGTAKAVRPSAVCFIDGETVRALIKRNPDTLLHFLRRLAGNLECAEEKLSDPGPDGLRRRVLRLLAGLRLAFSPAERGGEAAASLPLTEAELATAVGASPRALRAVLGRLEADGMLVLKTDAIRIVDADGLSAAVGDPQAAGRRRTSPDDVVK
ncbi:MAG: Crp/Fnr family transcriptional regulator [Rhodospirillales bacterium]